DAVIIAAGVVPISDLARDAGLAVHDRGGVFVDEFMRTSDPDIYAGGDCAIVKHLITGQPVFLPLGSMANRQGRVIGTNLAGGDARFDGVVGSFVVKLFETSLAGTGLSLEAALAAGFDAVSVLLVQLDRAHFYPTKELMTLEMIVEKTTRRVLGVQGFGSSGDAMVGRINAVAAILRHQPTVDDISNLEMAYAPPFASAMDVLNSLANLADNVLLGINRGVGPDGFAELWDQRDNGSCYFLDCREEADAGEYLARNPGQWHNIPQGKLRERLAEVPRDRPVVLVCNTGARSYEAQIILDEQGFGNVVNVQGGMAAIRKYGIDL
ncbi:MAG: FAD-dependent oxidoreductase, partial [Proteobacteria bacterium]|nr:FAD-dependent oxidoreductase [Pseudomonadota bacterium]